MQYILYLYDSKYDFGIIIKECWIMGAHVATTVTISIQYQVYIIKEWLIVPR